MVLCATALFFVIRSLGETPVGPAQATSRVAPAGPASDALQHLLVTLTAVVIAGRLLGRLLRRMGQPPVLGEVIAGVMLGPSLLGAVSPEAYRFVLAPEVVPYLGIVSQLGVVFYMFLVGVELNPDLMRGQLHVTVATSHASILVPFVLGSALALFLYPRFASPDVPFTSFALFIGIAMSITAFPVLARILSDLKLTKTDLGTVALTCAAVDDVTAWCLLALVVGVVEASTGMAVVATVLTLAFILLMFAVVRPGIGKALRASDEAEPGHGRIALAVVGMMAAALTTEAIGVHALFGAFLFGAVIPHDSRLAHALTRGFEGFVKILLLPAFFAFAGMRTEIGLLSGVDAWVACGLIVLVATAGKFGGTLVAARAGGLRWQSAAALGVLMNTRGLMQLIVLNVGLDLGVITPTLFTMMVVMALVTTIATTPALQMLLRRGFVPDLR
ncbi:MAG: cation:proton antiporter [Luteitalea sp.]|nr:cation:proton antiporter [Luteitalea sp.]